MKKERTQLLCKLPEAKREDLIYEKGLVFSADSERIRFTL